MPPRLVTNGFHRAFQLARDFYSRPAHLSELANAADLFSAPGASAP
jgi:hypothetical protein